MLEKSSIYLISIIGTSFYIKQTKSLHGCYVARDSNYFDVFKLFSSNGDDKQKELSSLITNLSKGDLKNEPAEVTAQRIKAAQSQDAASKQFLEASTVFGSGLVGISLGLVADIFAGVNEPLLPPLAASIFASAGTFALLKEAKNPSSKYSEELNAFSEVATSSLGRPILTAGEEAVASAKAKVRQTVDDIQAIPVKVQKRLDQTKEEIIQSLEAKKRDVLSIPSRLQQRVEQAKDKAIQSLEEEKQNLLLKVEKAPDDVKAYITAKVEERKKALAQKAKELQEEIAATPAALQARAVESAEATLTRLQELPLEAKDALAKEIQQRLDKVNRAAEDIRTKAITIASDPIAVLTKKNDGK
eukprot:gene29597-38719_t